MSASDFIPPHSENWDIIRFNELTRIGESSVYYAEFTAPDVENREDINPFVDIKRTDYFYNPVIWAVTRNPAITKGTSADRFSPDASCTRGQVVTFLWRFSDCPGHTRDMNPFKDISEKDYFYNAVLWAIEQSITNGTSAYYFSPNQSCTRGQIVTFLWRDKAI